MRTLRCVYDISHTHTHTQSNVDKHVIYSNILSMNIFLWLHVNVCFCAQICFLKLEPSHNALHKCISVRYISRAQKFCKQLEREIRPCQKRLSAPCPSPKIKRTWRLRLLTGWGLLVYVRLGPRLLGFLNEHQGNACGC